MKSLELVDQKGQHIGSVAEVILDINSGRVIAISLLVPEQPVRDQAAALQEVVIIPWDAIRFDRDFDCLRLVEHGAEAFPWQCDSGLVN